jgi:hypothetical protein
LLFHPHEWWFEITPISTEITPRGDISTPTLPTVDVTNAGPGLSSTSLSFKGDRRKGETKLIISPLYPSLPHLSALPLHLSRLTRGTREALNGRELAARLPPYACWRAGRG